jgi:hypothetical protein
MMTMRLKIDQLPPGLRKQAETQLNGKPVDKKPDIVSTPPKRKMTKTEENYERHLIYMHGSGNVHFEGLSFRLRNGHRYTPDFVCRGAGIYCYEVKGSYRLHSYSRARLAFDQARIEWPQFVFVWVEKQKDGTFKEVK